MLAQRYEDHAIPWRAFIRAACFGELCLTGWGLWVPKPSHCLMYCVIKAQLTCRPSADNSSTLFRCFWQVRLPVSEPSKTLREAFIWCLKQLTVIILLKYCQSHSTRKQNLQRLARLNWHRTSSGDAVLHVLQLGIGITDPNPLWHPQGLTAFDPTPAPFLTHDSIMNKTAFTLGRLLRAAAGICNDLCQVSFLTCLCDLLNSGANLQQGLTAEWEKMPIVKWLFKSQASVWLEGLPQEKS